MSTGSAIAVALIFIWLGMVLAISFLEAPLKFRAPNVTLQIGLGIGRLVFRALNTVEVAFALVIGAIEISGPTRVGVAVAIAVAVAALAIQLVAVRPALTRRADDVLAGSDGPRSGAHYAYVALETVKVIGLIVAGILLLSG
jgi:membrane protease YdiL (CAAX protease family)